MPLLCARKSALNSQNSSGTVVKFSQQQSQKKDTTRRDKGPRSKYWQSIGAIALSYPPPPPFVIDDS